MHTRMWDGSSPLWMLDAFVAHALEKIPRTIVPDGADRTAGWNQTIGWHTQCCVHERKTSRIFALSHDFALHDEGGLAGIAVIPFATTGYGEFVSRVEGDSRRIRFANFEKDAIHAARSKLFDSRL